jgi:hypothetical protein
MKKIFALLLVLVFLAASCLVAYRSVYASSPNSWVSLAPMNEARSGLGVAAVNGKIYAIGGTTVSYVSYAGSLNTGGVVGTNEEYDPATGNWTYKEPMPTPLVGFATVVYQNKIYCISDEVNEAYDPATDTWENKSAISMPEDGGQPNVVDGKLYLISESSTQVYDPANDSWTAKAPMPVPQLGVSAVLDHKIYVIGPTVQPFSSLTQIYDTQTDTWSQGLHPSPLNAYYTAAVATSGVMSPKRIYALGLVVENNGGIVTGDVGVYNPQRNSWTSGASVPTKREAFGAAVINDVIYIIGGRIQTGGNIFGSSFTEFGTVEQYTPFGYGTPDPSYVLEHTPPKISLLSPLNETYNETSLSVVLAVDKPVNWTGYSVDEKENVTITGNTTIKGLSNGLHSIAVYANDTFGNMGVSRLISFTLVVPEPFPTVAVAIVSAVVVALVGAGLVAYLKKRKHQTR